MKLMLEGDDMQIAEMPRQALMMILMTCDKRHWPAQMEHQPRAVLAAAVGRALAHAVKEPRT